MKSNPEKKDKQDLDIYDINNPNQPKYTDEFIKVYRQHRFLGIEK